MQFLCPRHFSGTCLLEFALDVTAFSVSSPSRLNPQYYSSATRFVVLTDIRAPTEAIVL
jgi:hypothetical protein